jgi:hypothetical protein
MRRKSFELCCASATSHSANADETPVARQVLDAMKATGQNPDLDELAEAVFQKHGIRLNKLEVARQLDGHRQGHSGTSAKAHDASCAAAEASDKARNLGEGDDRVELHFAAQTAHEEAARAHMKAWIYHGRAADYHKGKVLNQSAALNEPEDDESAE